MPSPDEWVAIYRETVEPLYRYVSRRVAGERSLAEDLTQEAYLRALEHWRNGNVPRSPIAWLRTVAANLVVDHFRRSRPSGVSPAELEALLDDAEPTDTEAAALLALGLSRLRSSQRRLLEGFHYEGRSVRALAEEHGLSERAVEGRLHRARRILRRRLRPYVRKLEGD